MCGADMEKSGSSLIGTKKIIPLFLLVFLVIVVYSNTFHADWHLDDYENITVNPNVHITDLTPGSLYKAFYKTRKKISRPFARLTFALNWYVGKSHVTGYHVVNIFIHIVAAFFLFLFIYQLFRTPHLKNKYDDHAAYFIALLSAVLWAIHPIQTQAVTYIVQRMASMAAMFYIISMYFYLNGRMGTVFKQRVFCFILSGISFGFGLATKENTAMLPVAILLMEIIFFQDMKSPQTRRKIYIVSAIVCCVLVLCSSWLFLNSGLRSLFTVSDYRYFTPIQRLMTEARVIVFYLSEIFYPVPDRFSIEHDIILSTSLLRPWTTLPAILFIISCIGFGFFQIKKRPLLSFGILFFFLNHFIESTVIKLEIIFEHRNYLPSFFLFLYISAVLQWMMDQYARKNKILFTILTIFIVFMVISFGISSYVRNMEWKTEQSLSEDAVRKAPHSARTLTNLATVYYRKLGRPDVALNMLKKALTLKKNNKHQEAIILKNIGSIYYENGNDKAAEHYLQKAIDHYPSYSSARYQLALAMANLGKLSESKKQLHMIISKLPESVISPLNLKGLIFIKERRYKEAFSLFRKCLAKRKHDKNALINLGALYYLTGDYQRAETYFKLAYGHHPHETFVLIWLIKVNLRVNKTKKADQYIDTLLSNVSAKTIRSLPESLSNKDMFHNGFIKPYPSKNLLKKISGSVEIKI